MINPALIRCLERESPLFSSLIHGLCHWRTVERNGLYLAQHGACDGRVVSAFAYFHDCMRMSEGRDPDHGARGAEYAMARRAELGLTDAQLDVLCHACRHHTTGVEAPNPTVAACWDADRLDLGRVGIVPDSKYLLGDEAKRIADERDFGVLHKYHPPAGTA